MNSQNFTDLVIELIITLLMITGMLYIYPNYASRFDVPLMIEADL